MRGGGTHNLSSSYICTDCKNQEICYNSDVVHYNYGEISRMKKGFTLAEVLVTLGIIGVVSAMTVPSLMQNHQKKTYVTQLHKVYNEIQQAFLQYKTDKNALTLAEAGFTSQTDVNSFLKNYFRTVTICHKLEEPCIPNADYRNLNGGSVSGGGVENVKNWWGNVDCAVLGSGAAICIESLSGHGTSGSGVKWSHILIDTNGMKGPNIGGRDVFFIAYYEDGTLDEEEVAPVCNSLKECSIADNAKTLRDNLFNSQCKSSGRFRGCFGKILNDNWEMNY